MAAVGVAGGLALCAPAQAASVYWTVFNPEGEANTNAVFVTYGSVDDMLTGQNPLSTFGGAGGRDARANIVGSASDDVRYWNLFNFEDGGLSPADSIYVEYNSFDDMVTNQNAVRSARPDGNGRAADAIGTGSDGLQYWTLFNTEGDATDNARYVLYDSVDDMYNDEDAIAEFTPDGIVGENYARHVVGTGSDGFTYWSLFNMEGDDEKISIYVTYDTLLDMANDENRVEALKVAFDGVEDRVGTGAGIAAIPVPAGLPLLLTGVAALGLIGARRQRRSA